MRAFKRRKITSFMRERQLPAVRMIGGPAGLTDDARESFLSGWFQARVS